MTKTGPLCPFRPFFSSRSGRHDLLGNRSDDDGYIDTRPDPDTSCDYTHNPANEYTSVCGVTVLYDASGNLKQDKNGYTYHYDYENRLVAIKKSSDTITVAAFEYDALGRRIEKVITGSPIITTRYYYDDQRIVLQTSVSGSTETDEKYFIFGNYIDEVLLMHNLAGTYIGDFYYGHDHLYSPTVLFGLNEQQAWVPVERYEYDVYGFVRILTSGYSLLTSSQYGNPYTFTGRELDSVDGNALKVMYYRARSYDPQTGRFLQRDPLEYEDGINLYEYVKSDPLIFQDPSGRSIITPITFPDPLGQNIDIIFSVCTSFKGDVALVRLLWAAWKARDGSPWAETEGGHPWQHCMWNCRMAQDKGDEFAEEQSKRKEDLDNAFADFADTIPDFCWDRLPLQAKKFMSDWVCSAGQESDDTDNAIGRGCANKCNRHAQCESCCSFYGVDRNTHEGPGTGRPYSKRCKGRYDILGVQ